MDKDTKKTREKCNREICSECKDCVEEPQYYRSQCRTHKDFEKMQHGPDKNKRFWELMSKYTASDNISIQQHIVKHVEYNLARTRCSMDKNSCYQAVAYSVRDRLIEANNDARRHHLKLNPKRAFYFSIEYLPGRSLRNALLNLDIEDNYKSALEELGYKLEDLYDEEQDPGLGNGGLGRLASCFLDSAATLEYPIWGYGIRYNYGIFKQKIVGGGQCEVPDYWLSDGYPWEIRRSDVGFRIRFYGKVSKKKDEKGRERVVWEDGEEVHALAYDQLIPGFNTFNTITLRLWRSRPTKEFDFASFTSGDYYKALQEKQKAEFISSVLYPNDTSPEGKELRLKQQYFFVSASLQDILRRFRFVNDDWNLLPEKTAIQLNDTHPTIAIVELLRLLVDLEGLEWDKAWNIVTKVFSYTNHTVMPEALEAWKEDMMGKLLPRHLELIHIINDKFLKEAEKVVSNNKEKLKALSIIDGDTIRMANLGIVGSHAINGVAEIHTQLLKDTIFKEFYEMWPDKFQNKTNGVTHRRWVGVANPGLAQLYTDELGTKDWLSNLEMVKDLLSKLDDCDFRKRWNDVKQKNKRRLLEWIQDNVGVTLREDSIFDIMIKRIHEYKRQLLNVLYVVHKYMKLKDASSEERKKAVPRSVLIGGKAAPGYVNAKSIIRLIVTVAEKINEDPDTSEYLKLVFLPNYSVSNAELYIPGADVTQSISTVGTEASGTSNMKFCMNGALLLGTMDGANVEIAEQVGEENMFIFGARLDELDDITKKLGESTVGDYKSAEEFNKAVEAIQGGMFGEHDEITKLFEHILSGTDKYLIAYDFKAYIEAQEKIDKTYQDREEWTKKSIITALNCSKFSSDRTLKEYAEQIWNIKPAPVPKPKKDQYEKWHVENRQAQGAQENGKVKQGRKQLDKESTKAQQESRNSLTGGA